MSNKAPEVVLFQSVLERLRKLSEQRCRPDIVVVVDISGSMQNRREQMSQVLYQLNFIKDARFFTVSDKIRDLGRVENLYAIGGILDLSGPSTGFSDLHLLTTSAATVIVVTDGGIQNLKFPEHSDAIVIILDKADIRHVKSQIPSSPKAVQITSPGLVQADLIPAEPKKIEAPSVLPVRVISFKGFYKRTEEWEKELNDAVQKYPDYEMVAIVPTGDGFFPEVGVVLKRKTDGSKSK